MKRRWLSNRIVFGALILSAFANLKAADWSTTELHYQRGALSTPAWAGGGNVTTQILTFQNATGWAFGDTFFFIDYLTDGKTDGFNDNDFYGELYANFSLGKISKRKIGLGILSDVGLLAGFNAAADANVRKWLPGVRLSWDLPGFAFFNTDLTAYIDDSTGVASGGAPAETNSFMLDLNWALPMGEFFSLVGHAEYIGERKNEFGSIVHGHVLAQPQLRYDLGKSLFNQPSTLFVGVEYQLWENKLGSANTDEKVAQMLVVWQF